MSFEKRDLEAKYILKIEEESMKSITLTPIVGLPLVQHDDDLSSLINTALTEQHYALEDGDIVVIKHQQTADNGETVVAVTENGATLKRYRNQNVYIFRILREREKLEFCCYNNLPISANRVGRYFSLN